MKALLSCILLATSASSFAATTVPASTMDVWIVSTDSGKANQTFAIQISFKGDLAKTLYQDYRLANCDKDRDFHEIVIPNEFVCYFYVRQNGRVFPDAKDRSIYWPLRETLIVEDRPDLISAKQTNAGMEISITDTAGASINSFLGLGARGTWTHVIPRR